MIIDSHVHLGGSHVTDSNYTEDQWLGIMEKNNVDAIFCLPLAEAKPSTQEMHDRIYRFAQDNPGKVYGVADVNPRWDDDAYKNEVRRCVKELGFVGLKLHPLLHGVNPAAKYCRKAFEIADELNIPLIVHTGTGAPASLPSSIMPRAKEFPNLKIVLAHSGMFYFAAEAIQMAKLFDNVYLESSWSPVHTLKSIISSVGVNKLMMGSDHPTNIRIELEKAKDLGLSEEDMERYMSGTAIEVFDLKL